VEIFENTPEHLPDFVRLNEAWIAEHFAIEDADRALAADPAAIIARGGYIFSLAVDGAVVGVCALFNEGDGTFELARMAVDGRHRRRGYGDVLLRAALEKLEAIGARRVRLLTNTSLTAAIALYEKHGFKTVTTGQHPVYNRCNLVMERPVP